MRQLCIQNGKTVMAITTAMIPVSFSMAPQATLALRAARGS